MKTILQLIVLLATTLTASATSYAFSIENRFAQSAIVVEAEVVQAKAYKGKICEFTEIEMECKVTKVIKGPDKLDTLRICYYAERTPTLGKVILFAFRCPLDDDLRLFNGESGLIPEGGSFEGLSYEELKAKLEELQRTGKAKPLEGFVVGTLDGPKPMDPKWITYKTKKD